MKTVLKRIFQILGSILLLAIVVLVILVIIPEEETVPPIQPRESTRYWEMSRGFKIAYTHLKGEGDVSKPPVVFLHGGPGGFISDSIIEVFKQIAPLGHDIYLYDQAGSGLSDRLPRYSDISFHTHISDLHEIIENHIKTDKVVLVGHSFGAILGAHFSAHHPDLVEKIIFSSPGELQPIQTDSTGMVIDLSERYPKPDSLTYNEPYNFVSDVDKTAITPKAVVATTAALLFDIKLVSDKQMDRKLNTLISKVIKGTVCDTTNLPPLKGGMGLYAFIATNNYSEVNDVRDKIRKLDIPALVIQGQCDYTSFSFVYEYADLYKKGRFEFIEQAGHLIWLEQPEEYVNVISDFLTKN